MDLKDLCIKYENYETDPWAADAILKKEIITPIVFDPCCGSGILSEAAKGVAKDVFSLDIHDWGYEGHLTEYGFAKRVDFLDERNLFLQSPTKAKVTCFMNPPFSKAVEFVERAIELGFRKIISFQRFAWYESNKRKDFWDKHPPNRVWICGDRATCWRHDIPINEEGKRYDPETGKVLASSSTAHAWFVWERDAPRGTILDRIYKEK